MSYDLKQHIQWHRHNINNSAQCRLGPKSQCWGIYTVFLKKTAPFYFCNNFVDPGPIWIISGRYVANEFSSGLRGLEYHGGLSVPDTDT